MRESVSESVRVRVRERERERKKKEKERKRDTHTHTQRDRWWFSSGSFACFPLANNLGKVGFCTHWRHELRGCGELMVAMILRALFIIPYKHFVLTKLGSL